MSDGHSLIRLAQRHIGEQYVLGAKVPKSNANWSGPWDCAEFTSWCTFQLTGKLFGCRPSAGGPDVADAYTGYWMADARTVGRVITVGEAVATRGAFLLRVPGAGTNGHVVISQGNGRTVEAHSTARGVIEGTVNHRRWSVGVLVPGITVGVGAPAPPRRPGLVLRVTKPRMSGGLVKAAQRRLRALGFHAGPIDGIYGPQTAAAVQGFQMSAGLVSDGEVGQRTARALGIEWVQLDAG